MEQRTQLFTVTYLYENEKKQPRIYHTNRDFLWGLENAATDRGDRSYHRGTGFFHRDGMWWRMALTYYFLIDVDGDDPRGIEWLVKRGFPESGFKKGYIFTFYFDNAPQLTIGSVQTLGKQKHVLFGNQHWVIFERFAVNLSRVVHFESAYGDMDVFHHAYEGGNEV